MIYDLKNDQNIFKINEESTMKKSLGNYTVFTSKSLLKSYKVLSDFFPIELLSFSFLNLKTEDIAAD